MNLSSNPARCWSDNVDNVEHHGLTDKDVNSPVVEKLNRLNRGCFKLRRLAVASPQKTRTAADPFSLLPVNDSKCLLLVLSISIPTLIPVPVETELYELLGVSPSASESESLPA